MSNKMGKVTVIIDDKRFRFKLKNVTIKRTVPNGGAWVQVGTKIEGYVSNIDREKLEIYWSSAIISIEAFRMLGES